MRTIYALIDTDFNKPTFCSYYSADCVLKFAEYCDDKIWKDHYGKNKPTTRSEADEWEIWPAEVEGMESFIFVDFKEPCID